MRNPSEKYPFKIGDNKTYLGFRNAPLPPGAKVTVWFQAVSVEPGCSLENPGKCDKNIECAIVGTRGVDPPPRPITTRVPDLDDEIITEKIKSVPSSGSVLLYGGIRYLIEKKRRRSHFLFCSSVVTSRC